MLLVVKKLLAISVLLFICISLPTNIQAETDDLSLFMDSFNAFKRKDYLSAIEKLGNLNQHFPDSPLLDISTLLLARSYQRAGYYQNAASTISRYSEQFGPPALNSSADEELLNLGKRLRSGERIQENRALQLTALKTRNEQLAQEKAAALKAERKEQKILATLSAARQSVKFALEPTSNRRSLEVETTATLPFKLVNQSTESEEFAFSATASTGGNVTVVRDSHANTPLQKVMLKPGEALKGGLLLQIPADMLDGTTIEINMKAYSTRFRDVSGSLKIKANASAPILRAISRVQKTDVVDNEVIGYSVTILNIGSQAAKEIDIRVMLPSNLLLADSPSYSCWPEGPNLAACRISRIESGMMEEKKFRVAGKHSGLNIPMSGSVELIQTVLQKREMFPGAAVNIIKKQ